MGDKFVIQLSVLVPRQIPSYRQLLCGVGFPQLIIHLIHFNSFPESFFVVDCKGRWKYYQSLALISDSYCRLFFEVRLCTEAKLRIAFRRVAFPSEISEELMTECKARLYAANEGLHNNE